MLGLRRGAGSNTPIQFDGDEPVGFRGGHRAKLCHAFREQARPEKTYENST
jgi:hypothetical protein